MTDQEFGGVVGRYDTESRPWWPKPGKAPEGSPDIVFIVLDDVGFSDLGCYGSEIETPNMDALSAGGLRYTNFHTTALCSPTRACLLTGRNHHSVGMGGIADWDMGYPGHRGRVAKSAGTLAEVLRAQGYGTYATGKWHLTPPSETSAAGPFEQWPLQRGFDSYYGFLEAETNQYHPDLTRDNVHLEVPNRPNYHVTEDIVDRSIELIRAQVAVAEEKPFFLYMCFGAAHAPHHAPKSFIDKYIPVFEKGWDRTREDRLVRQKALGVVPEGTVMPARNPGVKAWDDLDKDEKRFFVRLQAAYAGMLEHTDVHIGRLLAALDELGRADNTLVVLISDNGASQEGARNGTINALRTINGVRETVAENLPYIDQIGEAHLNNNYPQGWAMAGNTPLRRYKQNTHGGGVRDPLIVRWPRRIADQGGIRRQFHHVSDVAPTVLDVTGFEMPESIGGIVQKPLEGTSFAYSFAEPESPTTKQAQYFEMLGHRGIWLDGWKAVTWHAPNTDFDEDVWELYHVEEDFNEVHDLAEAEPERLRAMIDRWWVEAGRYNVLPLIGKPNRWAVASPHGVSKRRRQVYRPGGTRVPPMASPDLRNRSYSITATLEIPSGGADGILVAMGDWCGGYAFYVKDGHLVHDYNFVGRHHVVRSDRPLPEGAVTVRFAMQRTGSFRGIGRLEIDGAPCGEVEIPAMYRGLMSFRGLEVGRVSPPEVGDFTAPFVFAGTIREIAFDLGDDQDADDQALADAALRMQ
ncbi:MAG: arylsulfatase [Minwuia sp.]|uniref:arylsulfatase n=1 Tax=Minwuia sp. TaxID=2493630 RepID=UPI003A84AFE4